MKKKRIVINKIHLTVTNRNIHLVLTNKTNGILWKKSLGTFGIPGCARRAYNYNLIFGNHCGKEIKKQFYGYFYLIVKGWNIRGKAFLKGFFKTKLKLISIQNSTPIAYNGCRVFVKKRR